MSELGKSFPINVDKITDKINDKISKIPEIFVVRYELTPTSATAFTGTSDKTYSEIIEAWRSGKTIIAQILVIGMGRLQLSAAGEAHDEDEWKAVQFANIFMFYGLKLMYLVHDNDEIISGHLVEFN